MKRFLLILKWTGIVLGSLLLIFVLLVLFLQNRQFDAPYPNITAVTDSAVVARGKYLAYGPAHCSGCHSPAENQPLLDNGEELPLIGGGDFALPIGHIYSSNLTPDKETGIGSLTDQQIARALRYGVGHDGRALFDFMPFHNTSDDDLTAIISYLRAQKPVKNEIPANSFTVMGKIVKAFLVKPVGPEGEVPKTVKRDTTASYGRYIAVDVAECNGCHTKRDMAGKYIGEPFAGGNDIEGFITPNLTPDPSGRIYKWSQQNFIDRFRMGKLYPNSPMPWNSFKRMSDDELKAIYNFLRSTKPVHTEKIVNK